MTHHIVVNRPYPACILKVTHPLRQVKLDHADVAKTIRESAPAYMSEIRRKERKSA